MKATAERPERPTVQLCTECRRPLLLVDGRWTCCVRVCGEFGRAVEPDEPEEVTA